MKLHITIPATLRTPLRAVAERLNLALGATMRVAFAWYAGHKGRDLPADTMTARAYNAPVSTASAKFSIPAEWETAPGVAVPSMWVRALSEWLVAGTPTGDVARSRLQTCARCGCVRDPVLLGALPCEQCGAPPAAFSEAELPPDDPWSGELGREEYDDDPALP